MPFFKTNFSYLTPVLHDILQYQHDISSFLFGKKRSYIDVGDTRLKKYLLWKLLSNFGEREESQHEPGNRYRQMYFHSKVWSLEFLRIFCKTLLMRQSRWKNDTSMKNSLYWCNIGKLLSITSDNSILLWEENRSSERKYEMRKSNQISTA